MRRRWRAMTSCSVGGVQSVERVRLCLKQYSRRTETRNTHLNRAHQRMSEVQVAGDVRWWQNEAVGWLARIIYIMCVLLPLQRVIVDAFDVARPVAGGQFGGCAGLFVHKRT